MCNITTIQHFSVLKSLLHNQGREYDISGPHSGKYKDYRLLEYHICSLEYPAISIFRLYPNHFPTTGALGATFEFLPVLVPWHAQCSMIFSRLLKLSKVSPFYEIYKENKPLNNSS